MPHRKNEWFLRWESTMWARKNDEKEPLELDNWRRWQRNQNQDFSFYSGCGRSIEKGGEEW